MASRANETSQRSTSRSNPELTDLSTFRGNRTILPAPLSTDASTSPQTAGGVTLHKAKILQKRSQVTAVACTPCQRRKSKCDGVRPACSACRVRGRDNCEYDAAGDQRRTSALKLRNDRLDRRIKELEQESDALKRIIYGVYNESSRALSITIIGKLVSEGFRNLAQIAQLIPKPAAAGHRDAGLPRDAPPEKSEHEAVPSLPEYGQNVVAPYSTTDDGSYPAHWTNAMSVEVMEEAGLWDIPQGSVEAVDDNDDDWQPEASASASGRQPAIPFSPTQTQISDAQASSSTPASESFEHKYTLPSISILSSRRSSLGIPGRPCEDPMSWHGIEVMDDGIHQYRASAFLSDTNLMKCWVSAIIPPYELQPCSEIDEIPLSIEYLSFLTEKRSLINRGWNIVDALGLPDENVSSFVLGTALQSAGQAPQTVNQWAAEVVKTLADLQLPERAGMLVLISKFIRWRIIPSEETFFQLPSCMRPTPHQLHVKHPAWMDFIPWPRVRDTFIEDPSKPAHLSSLPELLTYASLNWSTSPSDLFCQLPGSDDFWVSPGFSDHVKDVNNWSVNLSLLSAFPMLAGKI